MTDIHSQLMGLIERVPYVSCLDVHRQYAVNWLMNNGVTVQKWIPVTERLPEEKGWYLTYTKQFMNDRYFITKCEWRGSWWGDRQGYPRDVTHWMPLPEAPKEVE